ncbi:MAG: hypothetical protein M3Z24_16750, partial [Chloroflexota bacterium]|nr:hypothetical protein [Chloroflexota bacterium]
MPKKSANTRSSAQRNKPKVQKSIELVRPKALPIENQDTQAPDELETTEGSVSTMVAEETPSTDMSEAPAEKIITTPLSTPPKGSVAARMAAKRLVVQ